MGTKDPLEEYKNFGISEAYDVVRTVELVKGGRAYRLEVQRACGHSPMHYEVRGWQEKEINGESIWARVLSLPSMYGPSPEMALGRALSEWFIG
jgi:hypothetical protein